MRVPVAYIDIHTKQDRRDGSERSKMEGETSHRQSHLQLVYKDLIQVTVPCNSCLLLKKYNMPTIRNQLIHEVNEEYTEENSEEMNNHSSTLLKTENERYRQEIHDLKRKFQLSETMLREAQEANELLEQTLDQRISEKDKTISEIEENHRIVIREYENTISNLETTITKQVTEIEELRKCINHRKEIEQETTAARECLDASFESANVSLNNQIDRLLLILQEEREKSKHFEELVEELQNRCNELENYSKDIKEKLDEKARVLEDVSTELASKRIETGSLEIDSVDEKCKGNSLFAEVEDRRRNTVEKMNSLREKYAEMKRICKSQIAEIKMLKAERVATLRKWENETDHISMVNEELIQKYKNRISDLESKLKSEIRKKDNTTNDNCADLISHGYFQTLMYTKNKEIDQLRIKVEDLSTKLLIQEEAKMNIIKRLQHWRQKASFLEAQIMAIKTESKFELTNNAECKVLDDK